MEKRDILIANSKDQSKYRVVTDAITLGQLIDAIANNIEVYKMVGDTWVSNPNPVDISGLDFTEGITKTKLLDRESLLPTNVQFKGQTTNNLVMLLTNTNKQIRSGAINNYPTDRKLFGTFIKENNLGGSIKDTFGDNWTRVKTDDLIAFFKNHTNSNNEQLDAVREDLTAGKQCECKASEVHPQKPEPKSASHPATVEWFYDGIKKMVSDNSLYADDVAVLSSLIADLAKRLEEEKPVISSSDIDDMMRSLH